MVTETDDYTYLKKWIASIKVRHIVIIAGIIIGLYALHKFGELREPVIDRTNYKVVAENFITKNATIAQKLGKITSLSHVGAGGSSGKESHNVYRVRGETATGVCYITLNKNKEGLWAVKTVTLMVHGAEYSIPVIRSAEEREIRLFD